MVLVEEVNLVKYRFWRFPKTSHDLGQSRGFSFLFLVFHMKSDDQQLSSDNTFTHHSASNVNSQRSKFIDHLTEFIEDSSGSKDVVFLSYSIS